MTIRDNKPVLKIQGKEYFTAELLAVEKRVRAGDYEHLHYEITKAIDGTVLDTVVSPMPTVRVITTPWRPGI